MDIEMLVGLLGLAGGGIAVWVQLNSRITRVEVQQELSSKHSDQQFSQILDRLNAIEKKLDHKVDRSYSAT